MRLSCVFPSGLTHNTPKEMWRTGNHSWIFCVFEAVVYLTQVFTKTEALYQNLNSLFLALELQYKYLVPLKHVSGPLYFPLCSSKQFNMVNFAWIEENISFWKLYLKKSGGVVLPWTTHLRIPNNRYSHIWCCRVTLLHVVLTFSSFIWKGCKDWD